MSADGDQSYVRRETPGTFSPWQDGQPLLGRLNLELTERCNNRCIHCCINLPEQDHAAARRELDTDTLKAILDDAARMGALTVRFTGGEPLVRHDFDALYLHARGLGLRVQIFTNARLVTAERADMFARVPPLEKIEVSVYGMTPATYEAVSGVRGSYAEFKTGVNHLLDKGVSLSLAGVALPVNKHEYAALKQWAESLPGNDSPPAYTLSLELRSRHDSESANRRLAALRLPPEEVAELALPDPAAGRAATAAFLARFGGCRGERLFACDIGRNPTLDAYGMLLPCPACRHPDLVYDLQKGSLEQALTEFFPALRGLKAVNPDYLARCAGCFLMGLCRQCPGRAWSESGSLDTPVEYLCLTAHAKARRLGLLADGEKAWDIGDATARARDLAGEPGT